MPDVNVVFKPSKHEGERIQVSPDPVKVDWGKKETVTWKLSTSDGDAVIEEIRFYDENPGGGPKGPFNRMKSANGKKAWAGDDVKQKDGTYKYDVVITDGSGVEHVLDPLLVAGNPPG